MTATGTAAIESLRARGAQARDPVRFSQIEAVARRAERHEGEARRVLDARLAQLVVACGEVLERATTESANKTSQQQPQSALAALLAHIARNAHGASGAAGTAGAEAPSSTGRAELKAVQQFRSTWTRLRVDQRLQQSQALVSENAGPLNTQRLLHQALTAMRDVSPEYLHRFMAHVEALLWVEQAGLAGEAVKKATRVKGG